MVLFALFPGKLGDGIWGRNCQNLDMTTEVGYIWNFIYHVCYSKKKKNQEKENEKSLRIWF